MTDNHEASLAVSKGPCDACGSSDACATYPDGHTYCFSCTAYTPPEGDGGGGPELSTEGGMAGQLVFRDMIRAGISERVCRRFGYGMTKARVRLEDGEHATRTVQVAPYFKNGRAVAQHWRYKGSDGEKQFVWRGSPKNVELWGQHLWDNAGRKILVITEGEKDALSWAEVTDGRWAVVSVPNGAQGAYRDIQRNLEWCLQYDSVVLMFDSDEPGVQAAEHCAELFPPGRVSICKLPRKDANEMLVAGDRNDLKWMPWRAPTWRPDEVSGGSELLDRLLHRPERHALPYKWPSLQEMTAGCRGGEIVMICAGTGIGKSELVRQMVFDFQRTHDDRIGYVALEESDIDSAVDFMGLHLGERLRLTLHNHSEEELKDLYREVIGLDGEEKFSFWNHFGSLESERLLSRIRFMVQGMGCGTIVLDHISIVVSGRDSRDERRDIDQLMTGLRSLVEELDCRLLIVSHLKRVQDKSHEEGDRVSLSHLRGSGSIAQLSDIVLGLERNQQSPTQSNRAQIRVLKNRWTGTLGPADTLEYDTTTGELKAVAGGDYDTPPVAGSEEDDNDDF